LNILFFLCVPVLWDGSPPSSWRVFDVTARPWETYWSPLSPLAKENGNLPTSPVWGVRTCLPGIFFPLPGRNTFSCRPSLSRGPFPEHLGGTAAAESDSFLFPSQIGLTARMLPFFGFFLVTPSNSKPGEPFKACFPQSSRGPFVTQPAGCF